MPCPYRFPESLTKVVRGFSGLGMFSIGNPGKKYAHLVEYYDRTGDDGLIYGVEGGGNYGGEDES